MRHTATLTMTLSLLLAAVSAAADDGKPPSTGLSVYAGAGAFLADGNSAQFYDGSPSRPNTINRILHSNLYGTQIWNDLVMQGLISPSAVGSYSQLEVAEYPPEMYYQPSLNISLGLRYDYASRFGWLVGLSLSELQTIGAFNLSTGGNNQLGSRQYIPCSIMGREKRISLEAALARTFPLSEQIELEIDLGGNLINTDVVDNVMEIASRTYSILDRWDGATPDVGVAAYADNINQGGIGYGIFATVSIGYRLPHIGAVRLAYTLSHSKTIMQDFPQIGFHHLIGIRMELNNFSL